MTKQVFTATLTNYNDHANVGLPMIFRVENDQFETIGHIEVDYDENNSPEYTGELVANGKLVNVVIGFRQAYEDCFDLENEDAFDFEFVA